MVSFAEQIKQGKKEGGDLKVELARKFAQDGELGKIQRRARNNENVIFNKAFWKTKAKKKKVLQEKILVR